MKTYFTLFGMAAGLVPLYAGISPADPANPFASVLEERLSVPLPVSPAPLTHSFGRLPLHFVRNDGQADAATKFLVQGRGYLLSLEQTETQMALAGNPSENTKRPGARRSCAAFDGGSNLNRGKLVESPQPTDGDSLEISSPYAKAPEGRRTPRPGGLSGAPGQNAPASWSAGHPPRFWRESLAHRGGIAIDDAAHPKALEGRRSPRPGGEPVAQSHLLRMKLVGAQANALISGEDELPGKFNYFIGNDPTLWRTNVPSFAKVRYHEIYPGIDLVFYGKEGELEYDFVVRPGADPNQIALEWEGADTLRIAAGGELILKVGDREVAWHKPVVYQQYDGRRHEVAGTYRLVGPKPDTVAEEMPAARARFVAFTLAAYDPGLPLVIDPRLAYSTYLGGSGEENEGQTVAVDRGGNVYIAGTTASVNFPAKAALRGSAPGGETDAFVAKFNGAGQLLFSTYLGGTAREEIGWTVGGYQCGGGIAFTASGDFYVVGSTQSRDFPLVDPLQPVLRGDYDVFVATLKSDGSALLFSTYLGGRMNDRPLALRTGPGDDLFVSGFTDSTDFPRTNAFQPRLSSPYEGWQQPDGFLARFEAGGKSIRYSTYYGRAGFSDRASGLAVDAEGHAYVALLAGRTGGLSGQWVIAKISPDGSTRLLERRWPATIPTYPIDQFLLPPQLALAPNGRLVLAAPVELDGVLLPAINDPDPSIYTWSKIYIALFDTTNGDYISAVYLGGIGNNGVGGLCVDAAGDIVVAGDASAQVTESGTEPSGFPVTDPLEQSPEPGSIVDVFVTKYRSSDLSMVFSTLLGGPTNDFCSGLALDPDGSAWVVGSTSGPFPTVNAFQPESAGGSDAFLAKITFGERLQIVRSGQTLRVSWPLAATGFALETADSPTASQWAPVPNPPLSEGAQNVVTLEASGDSRYFRLRKP